MIKLTVFDFDSILIDDETIEFLASEKGSKYEVSKITKKTMFEESK